LLLDTVYPVKPPPARLKAQECYPVQGRSLVVLQAT
jgi:hypothetical protein